MVNPSFQPPKKVVRFVVFLSPLGTNICLYQCYTDKDGDEIAFGNMIERSNCRKRNVGETFRFWFNAAVRPEVKACVLRYEEKNPDFELVWDEVAA